MYAILTLVFWSEIPTCIRLTSHVNVPNPVWRCGLHCHEKFEQKLFIIVYRVPLASLIKVDWCSVITDSLHLQNHDSREAVLRALNSIHTTCSHKFSELRTLDKLQPLKVGKMKKEIIGILPNKFCILISQVLKQWKSERKESLLYVDLFMLFLGVLFCCKRFSFFHLFVLKVLLIFYRGQTYCYIKVIFSMCFKCSRGAVVPTLGALDLTLSIKKGLNPVCFSTEGLPKSFQWGKEYWRKRWLLYFAIWTSIWSWKFVKT